MTKTKPHIFKLSLLAILCLLLFSAIYFSSKMSLKTYQDPQGYFSFNYPSNWTIETVQEDPQYADPRIPKESKDLTLKGPEGQIEIVWGNGFGGACPDGYEKLKFKSETLDTCHSATGGNYHHAPESWEQSTKVLNSDNLGVGINAYVNAPVEKNRNKVLNILSSMEFNPR